MLLQEGGRGEAAEEANATAAAASPLAATPRAGVDLARRGVARWRAPVAERKGVLLLPLRLLQALRLSVLFHSSAFMGNVLGIGFPSSGAGGYGAHDRHELLQRVDLLLRIHPPPPPAPPRPPLLALLEDMPYLFEEEVLKRLDPMDRTMLAQVGRPWYHCQWDSDTRYFNRMKGHPKVGSGARMLQFVAT